MQFEKFKPKDDAQFNRANKKHFVSMAYIRTIEKIAEILHIL